MGGGLHRGPLAFPPVRPAPPAGRCRCPSVNLGPGGWGEDCRPAGVQRAPRGETSHHIVTTVAGTAFAGTFYLPTAPAHCTPSPWERHQAHFRHEEKGQLVCPRSQPSRAEPAGDPGHRLLRSVLCTRITAHLVKVADSDAVGLGCAPNISNELPAPSPDTPLSASLPGLSKDSSQSLVRGIGRGSGGLLGMGGWPWCWGQGLEPSYLCDTGCGALRQEEGQAGA